MTPLDHRRPFQGPGFGAWWPAGLDDDWAVVEPDEDGDNLVARVLAGRALVELPANPLTLVRIGARRHCSRCDNVGWYTTDDGDRRPCQKCGSNPDRRPVMPFDLIVERLRRGGLS